MKREGPRRHGGGQPKVGTACAEEAVLRILIGLEGLALGGCPINAIDLGRTLRERGHHVSLFAIDEDAPVTLLPVAERAGFRVTVLPRHARSLARARQMRDLVRANRADIIHVFGPWLGPGATIAAADARRRAAVVTNWTMDHVDYTPPGTTLIVGTRQLEVQAAATRVPGTVHLQEPPVDILADEPNAVAARRFRHDWQIADGELVLMVVSRLDKVMKAEGIAIAIHAIGQMSSPMRLIVVGDGNARTDLEAEAARVNQQLGRQAIVFTGAIHDPRPAYDAADIAYCMGGSALRALGHGKPLIVPGINGFSKTFGPTTTGYFYEHGFFGEDGAADPVADLIRQLADLQDEERRDELGRFGAAEVRRRFGLDVGAARLESIYREALAGTPRAPVRLGRALALTARLAVHEVGKALRR